MLNRRFILRELREAIRQVSADIVFLQEIRGESPQVSQSQYEYLADTIWSDFAYGKNAVYTNGDHGNAILSKFPIIRSSNTDLSVNRFEKRGLLHCRVKIPQAEQEIDCFSVHLNLLLRDRKKQVHEMTKAIESLSGAPSLRILAGDFNDWSLKNHRQLEALSGFREAYREACGHFAKTWPAVFPILSLDRIYQCGLETASAKVLRNQPWTQLSDHLPVLAELVLR